MKPLDKIDQKILMCLQSDGRMSNTDLAKKINLSPTPCLERVRKLEKTGYIESYHAKLSAVKMKANFMTFMTIKLDQTNENLFDDFKLAVDNIDEIVECHMVGGGFDYILKIRTETMEEFRTLMGKRLAELPGVLSTSSFFVMEETKNTRFYKVPSS